MPNLDAVTKFDIPDTTLRVDIDQVQSFYPTLACVPNGKNEADDDVKIKSSYVDGEKALLFRFKSEVDGTWGLYGLEQGFGRYSIVLTEKGNIFAVSMKNVKDEKGNDVMDAEGKVKEEADFSRKYLLGEQGRVTLLIAQALHCYAYSQADAKAYDRFESFAMLADYLDNNRQSLTAPADAASSNDPYLVCRKWGWLAFLCFYGQGVSVGNGGW